jgi:hypothetical protein
MSQCLRRLVLEVRSASPTRGRKFLTPAIERPAALTQGNGSREDAALGVIARAAGCLLISEIPARRLLLRAKYLFVRATIISSRSETSSPIRYLSHRSTRRVQGLVRYIDDGLFARQIQRQRAASAQPASTLTS